MSRQTFTVLITDGDYWYDRFISKSFDVQESRGRSGLRRKVYNLVLSIPSIQVIEEYHENKMHGANIIDAKTNRNHNYANLWIDPEDCIVITDSSNCNFKDLLDDCIIELEG